MSHALCNYNALKVIKKHGIRSVCKLRLPQKININKQIVNRYVAYFRCYFVQTSKKLVSFGCIYIVVAGIVGHRSL